MVRAYKWWAFRAISGSNQAIAIGTTMAWDVARLLAEQME
jgi:hypothetical protein